MENRCEMSNGRNDSTEMSIDAIQKRLEEVCQQVSSQLTELRLNNPSFVDDADLINEFFLNIAHERGCQLAGSVNLDLMLELPACITALARIFSPQTLPAITILFDREQKDCPGRSIRLIERMIMAACLDGEIDDVHRLLSWYSAHASAHGERRRDLISLLSFMEELRGKVLSIKDLVSAFSAGDDMNYFLAAQIKNRVDVALPVIMRRNGIFVLTAGVGDYYAEAFGEPAYRTFMQRCQEVDVWTPEKQSTRSPSTRARVVTALGLAHCTGDTDAVAGAESTACPAADDETVVRPVRPRTQISRIPRELLFWVLEYAAEESTAPTQIERWAPRS